LAVKRIPDYKVLMMEKENIHKDNILERDYLKENPYTLPKGYFAQLEDSVSKRIHTDTNEQERGLVPFLKTAVMLACTFGIIIGMGYGAMYMTNQSKESTTTQLVENDSYYNTPDGLAEDDIIEIMSTAAILETLAEEDEFAQNNFDSLEVNKDNIEEYLIESNISLITLASLE
jgi:predicted outer membrane lipoprotein